MNASPLSTGAFFTGAFLLGAPLGVEVFGVVVVGGVFAAGGFGVCGLTKFVGLSAMLVGFLVGSAGLATLTTGAGGVIFTVDGFLGVAGVVAGAAAGCVAGAVAGAGAGAARRERPFHRRSRRRRAGRTDSGPSRST